MQRLSPAPALRSDAKWSRRYRGHPVLTANRSVGAWPRNNCLLRPEPLPGRQSCWNLNPAPLNPDSNRSFAKPGEDLWPARSCRVISGSSPITSQIVARSASRDAIDYRDLDSRGLQFKQTTSQALRTFPDYRMRRQSDLSSRLMLQVRHQVRIRHRSERMARIGESERSCRCTKW